MKRAPTRNVSVRLNPEQLEVIERAAKRRLHRLGFYSILVKGKTELTPFIRDAALFLARLELGELTEGDQRRMKRLRIAHLEPRNAAIAEGSR